MCDTYHCDYLPHAQFLIVTQRGITASSFGRQFIESIVWYGMIIECSQQHTTNVNPTTF